MAVVRRWSLLLLSPLLSSVLFCNALIVGVGLLRPIWGFSFYSDSDGLAGHDVLPYGEADGLGAASLVDDAADSGGEFVALVRC